MKSQWHMTSMLLVLGALAGFGTTYAWQSRQSSQPAENPAAVLGGWLSLLPDQVGKLHDADPEFAADRTALEAALAAERETLAEFFEKSDASDQRILDQVERVIAAHDALERRVAKYLLAIRGQLTPAQRDRLFERCATGVREAGGWRWRGGRGGDDDSTRRGGGPPADRGRGAGRGRGGPPWSTPATTQSSSHSKGDKP